MQSASLALAFVLTLTATASAQLVDPDTEVARRRYERGATLYDEQRYEEAAGEFAAANLVKPSPHLEYNIARCFDRLERWRDAVDAYERYLASSPADAAEVRARVDVLRCRVDAALLAPKPAPAVQAPAVAQEPTRPLAVVPDDAELADDPPPRVPVYRRWWLWAVIGGVVAAGVGVGVGVGLTQGGERFPMTTQGVYDVRWP